MKKKTGILTFVGMVILTIGMIVFAGCDFNKPSKSSEAGSSSLQIPLFKMEYDETMSTYALHWPGGTIYNPGMSKTMDEDVLYLVDYQATHHSFTINDSGYFNLSKENFEGDESIRMPIEIWNQTESTRPARSPSSDPVNKVVFADGFYQRFGISGALISSSDYDQEEFRIDPSILDSLFINVCDTCSMNMRNNILQSIENSGINYWLTGDDHVVIEKELIDPYFSKVKKLIDLKTGLTMRSALFREDGQFDSVHLPTYKLINGIPVKAHNVGYYFGQVNGNWQAKIVKYTDRNNIDINIKRVREM